MRRRDFIMLGCGAATAVSQFARAQQPPVPIIGFLHSGASERFTDEVTAFRQGLREAGYIEGQNVGIEFRWANNQFERLPALAADLVSQQAAVIFAAGGAYPPRAAKAATSTIPIIFAFGDDPVQHDLVTTWSRPGGNITGVTTFSGELASKRLELLSQLVPRATTIAYICDPRAVTAEWQTGNVLAAARSLNHQVMVLEVAERREIDAAFAQLVERRADALLVGPYPVFIANRDKLLALVAQHKIPAMYSDRLYTRQGGLVSYGASFAGNYRQGALYVGRILKGAKPAELPVQQATKFDLVINLKTAKSLGLTVPRILLAAADELID